MVLQPQKSREKERELCNVANVNENTSNKDNCKQCIKNRKEKSSPKHAKPHTISSSNSSNLVVNMYQTSSHPGTPVTQSAPSGKLFLSIIS